MRPFQFISVKLALCLITGILIGKFIELPIFYSSLILISTLAVLVLIYPKSRRKILSFGITSSLTTIALGIFIIANVNPKNSSLHYINQKNKKTQLWHLKIDDVLKPNSYSNRYIAKIMSLNHKRTRGKLLINISKDSTTNTLFIDDEIITFVNIKEINKPLNPYQFNYASYMNELGISHKIQLNKEGFIKHKHESKSLKGIAAIIRNKIIDKLKNENFGSEELNIIKALLLGQRNDIDPDTLAAYKNAGAMHILALSGLHIGVLLLLLQFILKPLERLPKGKTIKLIVIVFLLWGFAFLAGFSDSLIRAVTMFTFVAYAIYLNRPTSSFNILALSLFFILLIKPNLLFSVGLQMSYAAVFSIVLFNPIFLKMWKPKTWLSNKIWQLMVVSISAQLGVLPISLYYFHQFPSLFFISNLLIIPFLGLILGVGVLVIILALLNSLPSVVASWYNTVIYLMNSIIKWVASKESFVFEAISFDRPQLILSYSLLFLLLLFLTKRNFKNSVSLLTCILLFQGWTIYSNYKSLTKEEFLVLHKNNNTILLHKLGKQLSILSNNKNANQKIIMDYLIAERMDTILHKPLKNNYIYKKNRLSIIDSIGIYTTEFQNSTILLIQSPKTNLERLIEDINPKMILADGSNYKNVVADWKKTCSKKKIPFHHTGEKGYYVFNQIDD